MAYSYVVYTGNGATTQFALTFPYIRKEHVVVSVDYVSTAFTWVNDSTVQVSPAPANASRVEVRRVTPVTAPLVDFTDGSTLVAADLDINALQQTYINQEQDDQIQDGVYVDANGNLTAGNQRLKDLLDPIDPQDAATKNWVETSTSAPLVQFRSIFYGAYTSDPATDPYGNARTEGDLYFNSTLNQMRVFNGATWQDASADATITRFKFTAVGGETSLSGADDNAEVLSYNVGLELVYLNGALLTRGVDYTATNGSSITGLAALAAADLMEVVAFSQINAVDSIPGANIVDGTIVNAKIADDTITSAKIADGTIVNADVNAAAAIAGTKISPDFGSQNVVTTGNVGIGTTSPGAALDVAGGNTGDLNSPAVFIQNSKSLTLRQTSGNWGMGLYVDNSNNSYTVGLNNLIFGTGVSATERARIDSDGRLLVGTSTAQGNNLLQIQQSGGGFISLRRDEAATAITAGEDLGAIQFQDNAGNVYAEILAEADATAGSGDYPGRLVFSTTADGASSPTEKMRIGSDGVIDINTANGADPIVANSGLIRLYGPASSSAAFFESYQNPTVYFNRRGNDGQLVQFRQDNTEEGNISVAGNTVSYNQFLGSHWAALSDWNRPEIKLGTILETINELTDWKLAVIEADGEQKKICYNGTAAPGSTVLIEHEGKTYEGIVELESDPEFNKAVKVKVNDTAASKAVYGVFVGWNNDSSLDGGTWNDMYVGAVGNYVIRMAAGQEPEIGDLVEADGTGCAVVQDDDIIRTKTVAKITSTIPQVTYDDGSFLVTCVLYCG